MVFLSLKQVDMVDMVDMVEMRDFMDKEQFTEFTVDVGSWYELPVDSSLNQIEQKLKNTYAEKGLSRQTISKALSDLSKINSKASSNSTTPRENGNHLYEQILTKRYRTEWEDYIAAPTHPAAIVWEEIPLIEALTMAKARNPKAVGEDLARLTLDTLLETQLPIHIPEGEESFISLQLLRNTYAQWHLIEKHQEHIIRRLNLIHSLTQHHIPKIAGQNMRLAFPALDALIVDMLANSSPEFSVPKGTPLQCLNDLYDDLRSIRDKSYVIPTEGDSSPAKDTSQTRDAPQPGNTSTRGLSYHSKKIRFSLPKGHKLLAPLQKGLSAPWRNMPSQEKASLRKNYEQYLLYHFKLTEASKQVQSFLEEYRPLSAYVQNTESWEQIRPVVHKELQEYIQWIFNDVQAGNVVLPYTYSEYKETTSSSAFIAILTKYAHDQIRAAVHHPLRLLLMVYYIKALNLLELRESTAALEGNFQAIQACLTLTTGAKLRVDDSAKSFDDILSPTLGAWMEQAERAIETLKEEHPHLPLATVTEVHDLTAFLDAYEEGVPEFFSEGLLTREFLLSCAESISSDTVSLLSKVLAAGELLRASTQLVTAGIAQNALVEIGKRYQALRNAYDSVKKNLDSPLPQE